MCKVGAFLEWEKVGPLWDCVEVIPVTFYKLEGNGFLPLGYFVHGMAGLRIQRISGCNLAVWELFRKKMWGQELRTRVLIVHLVT